MFTKYFLGLVMGMGLFSMTGFAQEAPKVEVFGGYSFLHQEINMHGWNASITGNVNNWFGVTGDFSQHFASENVIVGRDVIGINVNDLQYRVGPKFSFRGNPAVTPFLHVLIGGARLSGGSGVGGFNAGLTVNALSAAAGGGLDFKVAEHVAIRAVQAEYGVTHNSDYGTGHGARVSSGVVFRF